MGESGCVYMSASAEPLPTNVASNLTHLGKDFSNFVCSIMTAMEDFFGHDLVASMRPELQEVIK